MKRIGLAFLAVTLGCSAKESARTTDDHARTAVDTLRRITGVRPAVSPSLARVRFGDDVTVVDDAKSDVGVAVRLVGKPRGAASLRDGVRVRAFDVGDSVHELRADGVEEWLLLPRTDAKGEARWSVRLVGGAAALRLVDEVLEVLDAQGAPRLRANRPFVVDAKGTRHPARYDVEGCAVDRSPAPPWGRAVVAPGASSCTLVVRWELVDPPAGPLAVDPAWTATGNMIDKRAQHIAVQYAPFRVLVAGGYTGTFDPPVSTAEVWDASSGTWAATSPVGGRYAGAGAKLSDGVLAVGGLGLSGLLLSSTRWNSTSGAWTSVAGSFLWDASAVTLADGKVLVSGGYAGSSTGSLSTASVYDPGANTWTATGPMTIARRAHASALLGAKVLVAGGNGRSTAEIYDPGANTFTATGSMSAVRGEPAMVAISSTKAVVIGGDSGTTDLSTVEVFDLGTGAFTMATGKLPAAVIHHSAALLGSGHVLVAGGYPIWRGGAVFDPASGAVRETSFMDFGYWNGVAGLSDGRVLVTGGWPSGPTDKAYVYAEQADGAACGASGDCLSGKCYDAKCCTTCTGTPSCTTDDACAATEWCDLTTTPGKCTAKKANGVACTASTECTSAHCTDGVCCDTACGGTCQACSAAKKGGGADGTCAPVAAGTDPKNQCTKGTTACGADGMCNGAGACRVNAPSGTTCGSTTCTAGVASGLLCDGAGACITSSATCAPFGCGTTGCKTTCASDDDCAADAYCSSTNVCLAKVSNGTSCTLGKQCKSGYCADGVCCNTACTGQCEACDVAPNAGSCSPVTGEPHGSKTKCKGAGTACAGSCDGTNASACGYPGATTACGSACADGKEQRSACDGAGGCVAGSPTNCAPLVCGSDKCLTTCTKDEECTLGYVCKDGGCVPRPSAKCNPERTKSIGAEGETECSPYLCNAATGDCLKSCERSDQCAAGYICDSTTRCVPAPTATGDTEDSGGCGFGGRAVDGALPLIALGLLAIKRRRR